MNYLLIASLLVATYYGTVTVDIHKKGRIGIRWDMCTHRIQAIYKGSPAETAGLRIGDVITAINEKDLIGPAFTYVNVTVRRGTRVLHFTIERLPVDQIGKEISKDCEEHNDINPDIDPRTC